MPETPLPEVAHTQGGKQDQGQPGPPEASGTGCRQAAVPTSLPLEDGQGAREWLLQQTSAWRMLLKYFPGDH